MEEKYLEIKEEKRDLFLVPQGYYLAHCISGDYMLGAGLAAQFVDVYNMRNKLHHQYPITSGRYAHVGEALLVDNVFNLVTKPRSFQKPTYNALYAAVEDMANQIEKKGIEKLAIPMLGCGKDKLNWDKVVDILEEIFDDYDLEIMVCSL